MSGTIKYWALATIVCGACGPVIPKELANARTAYQLVASGPAATAARAEVLEARQALTNAEQAYASEGASDTTRTLAEQAERKAIAAQDVCAARIARVETPAPAPMPETVTKTEVITLPGEVLFAFDEAELLPAAKKRLDTVATSLIAKDAPSAVFTIAGHTDAVGSEEYNKDLSERRAAAVRDHLVSKGLDESKIQIVGKGEDEPFTTNATAEGRANNRRVEINVDLKKGGE